MIICSLNLSGDWKTAAGLFFGMLVGAAIVYSGFSEGSNVRKTSGLGDATSVMTLLLSLMFGIVFSYVLWHTGCLKFSSLAGSSWLWSTVIGAILFGIGLWLCGHTPLCALSSLGTGNLGALWTIGGMLLALPLAKETGKHMVKMFDGEPNLSTFNISFDMWSSSNSALYFVTGLLAASLILYLIGRSGRK